MYENTASEPVPTMVSSKPAVEAFGRSKDRKKLESATKRTVSMRAHHTPELQVNSLSQSPPWRLPQELLTKIYKLAPAELPDEEKRYPPRAPYIRPGYHALPKRGLGLLLTCRRMWLESCMLPLWLATFTWWFGTGARWGTFKGNRNRLDHEAENMRAFFKNLTSLNRTDVSHVRLFADLKFLKLLGAKSDLYSFFGDDQLYIKTLTISIRDIDWSLWRT